MTRKRYRFPLWSRWGFTVFGWRIAGFHRSWGLRHYRKNYPIYWRHYGWRVLFFPYTSYGVGWQREV